MVEYVHKYTLAYARKQGYNWTKNTGMNMCQNQQKQVNNQQIHTDRTIPNNKPDIIISDNEKRTCMLIDVAISGDRNVIK